jgi:hypothetical protein
MSPALALPRGAAIATSAVTGLAVGLVQLWLMKAKYPQANYGSVHIWMIAHDWWKLQKWCIALLFMTPFLWTLREAWRYRYFGEGASGALTVELAMRRFDRPEATPRYLDRGTEFPRPRPSISRRRSVSFLIRA